MSEIWNEQLQDIIYYLNKNLSDLMQRYIFEKEIEFVDKPQSIDIHKSK